MDRVPNLQVWEYGARLTEFLNARGAPLLNQVELRAKSSRIASPEDIAALDDHLLQWASETRAKAHALIDTHPVTKETYGFRVTAFSAERIRELSPNEIWLFCTAPEVTLERIARDPAGRPAVTLEEARMHSLAQASVACTFGVAAGCPVYMFDTDVDQDQLVEKLASRLLAR